MRPRRAASASAFSTRTAASESFLSASVRAPVALSNAPRARANWVSRLRIRSRADGGAPPAPPSLPSQVGRKYSRAAAIRIAAAAAAVGGVEGDARVAQGSTGLGVEDVPLGGDLGQDRHPLHRIGEKARVVVGQMRARDLTMLLGPPDRVIEGSLQAMEIGSSLLVDLGVVRCELHRAVRHEAATRAALGRELLDQRFEIGADAR